MCSNIYPSEPHFSVPSFTRQSLASVCPQKDTPRGHTAHVPVLDSQNSGSRDRRILSKFKAALSYTVRPCLKKQKTTKGRGGHWAIFALGWKIKKHIYYNKNVNKWVIATFLIWKVSFKIITGISRAGHFFSEEDTIGYRQPTVVWIKCLLKFYGNGSILFFSLCCAKKNVFFQRIIWIGCIHSLNLSVWF